MSDPPSLRKISCPIVFLSPANDFHGRINDLPIAISEIRSAEWRVTCSPHHNHQDTPPYEVASQLWFDQHLKKSFRFPESPKIFISLDSGNDPLATIEVDESRPVLSIDVFYSQQGQVDGKKDDSQNTKIVFGTMPWSPKEGNGKLGYQSFRLKNRFGPMQMFGTN